MVCKTKKGKFLLHLIRFHRFPAKRRRTPVLLPSVGASPAGGGRGWKRRRRPAVNNYSKQTSFSLVWYFFLFDLWSEKVNDIHRKTRRPFIPPNFSTDHITFHRANTPLRIVLWWCAPKKMTKKTRKKNKKN